MSELVTLIQLIVGLGKLILIIIIGWAIMEIGIGFLNLMIKLQPY
jgi:hypothetical protein